MSSLNNIPLNTVRSELLQVATECHLRGLTHSAKWSSELASSLSFAEDPCKETMLSAFTDSQFVKEYDRYSVGKCYFDSKEFARASHHLRSCQSRVSRFLYYYARYMDGEKKKRAKMIDVLNADSGIKNVNPNLDSLKDDFAKEEDKLDGFCFYLYGVVLYRLGLDDKAIEILQKAIKLEPLHWGSWEELATLCKDRETVKELQLPSHWMTEFFYAFVELELHMNEEALTKYNDICNLGFSESLFIKSQIATALYNIRDFDASVEHFKDLHEADPYMLDHADTYSNILYIQDERSELSYLAHHVSEVDKYRTESCGVVGNYYSLRGDHDKAVLYFKQALRLNPEYIAAWTLLGHEYVELKNTNAAIESYRRATEVNARDYRAWYGLGQTYELLKMPFYSLYYFREAQKLRPNDARMLVALGDTYQNLEKANEAKKCYLRAVRLGDSEGQAAIKLAKLHQSSGEDEEASKLFCAHLERLEQLAYHNSEDLAQACLFLARYHMRNEKYEEANIYARKGTEYQESREEAKTLLIEISKSSKVSTIKQDEVEG